MNAAASSSLAATSSVLAQWDEWSSRCTDRLFDLDARVTATGTDDDRLDLAAVFVARKAVVERIGAMRALDPKLGAKFDALAAALATSPLVDDQGSPVANDLAGAAQLIDAVLGRIEQHITVTEQSDADLASVVAALDVDLADAQCLSEQLGIATNRLAELTTRRVGALRTVAALTPVAADAATLAAELRAADAQRVALLARLAGLPAELAALRAREVEVRATVTLVREKVRPVPNLAPPSVQALGEPDTEASLAGLPWSAARARVEPYVSKVERLGAALDEVERRYRAALERRDDLRGLLQAYRDKAGARGLAEDAVLEPKYRAAETLLWTAPCDLEAAERLVADYTASLSHALRPQTSAGLPAADVIMPLAKEDQR